MGTTNRQWARAYALQALSDLRAREALVQANADKCHRLHFLQMAAERTCKAFLTAASGHQHVRKTHAYIAGTLPIIARQFYGILNDKNSIRAWEIAEITRLSREIQLSAPACDDGERREDNSEYPWQDAQGNVRVPCEYGFPGIDDGNRSIIRLIRLIRTAAESCCAPTEESV
jgi:hypothetical protein